MSCTFISNQLQYLSARCRRNSKTEIPIRVSMTHNNSSELLPYDFKLGNTVSASVLNFTYSKSNYDLQLVNSVGNLGIGDDDLNCCGQRSSSR
ncbi:hypothetical protein TNIN_80941 [Trichonephila inaurata madagascariensis]|uniref:Uncharacterized protein n=1 Tax=Trichonephila inaurata madagascariensis TaxID=2747483 RepID=A0A8X7BZR9_9ARAC|nr:hypothetical protein TNIN_80941 [Trichonephila inaurata madagascariensis]